MIKINLYDDYDQQFHVFVHEIPRVDDIIYLNWFDDDAEIVIKQVSRNLQMDDHIESEPALRFQVLPDNKKITL